MSPDPKGIVVRYTDCPLQVTVAMVYRGMLGLPAQA